MKTSKNAATFEATVKHLRKNAAEVADPKQRKEISRIIGAAVEEAKEQRALALKEEEGEDEAAAAAEDAFEGVLETELDDAIEPIPSWFKNTRASQP